MASISGNGSKGHHKFTLTVTENSTSTANNTSSVSFSFVLSPIQTSWDWYYWGSDITYTVTINGTKYTGTIPDYDGSSTVTLKSGTLNVAHNDDGKKTLSFSFSVTDTSGQTYTCGNASGSGTLTLTAIPRYATSNQSLNSKTETTIKMNWSSDSTIDYVWYSTDWGTTWKAVGSVNATSGSYTISTQSRDTSSLSASTTYNILTRVRRKDSQLTTNSSKLSVTTYDYPYCTDAPSFTIGNSLTIKFYNPLSRNISWQILGNDSSIIAGNSTTGTSYTGINGEGSINNLYASIPSSKNGTYTVKVTYGSSVKTKTGGTYSIKGTETPTVGTITYADTNATVTAITGNNQHIVQNQSNLKVTFATATAKNSATIAKHTFVLNGVTKTSTASSGTVDFATIDSSNNIKLTVTVTDSRGLTASVTKTITMLAHSNPTALVTLERLNNYEDETYLTVDGSIASVNSKNTMTIKYRYKLSGGSYGTYTTIGDRAKQTLSLDKNNVYIFNVVVTDAFGSTFNGEFTLNKGVFPLFIDTVKNSVGVNCFPNNDNSFEIDGLISASSIKCKNLLYTPYTEDNKLTITATKDDNYVITGYYCYLETGKKYTCSCKTDGTWGGDSGTDTVELFLGKDKEFSTYVQIGGSPKTFTVSATGLYYLRCDVNQSGATHSFWDLQIEEGSVATEFSEAKQFNYQEKYYLDEHKVGYWFDGKPIYRQIKSLTSGQFGTTEVTTGQNYNIAHHISNIKDIVKTEDMWCTNGQYRKFPSNYYGNAGWDGHYYCTKSEICFELGSAIFNRLISATSFLYIIIYYTKTTD